MWFNRHGVVGWMVGPDDLRGLFQPMILWFYGSMILFAESAASPVLAAQSHILLRDLPQCNQPGRKGNSSVWQRGPGAAGATGRCLCRMGGVLAGDTAQERHTAVKGMLPAAA